MSREKRTLFWIAGLAVFVFVLHSLSGILMPFVAGMAIAYFLDPVADKLEDKGLSRTLATTAIIAAFFFVAVGVLVLLFPLLVPLLLSVVSATRNALSTDAGWPASTDELLTLLGFAGVAITASVLLFDYVWND